MENLSLFGALLFAFIMFAFALFGFWVIHHKPSDESEKGE